MTFYLVDRITELHPSRKKISAVKCWSLDNEIFQDHFPGQPVVPGVLLTESMAQMLGVLIEKSYALEYPNAGKVSPILSVVQKAKFRKFVRPGDQCLMDGVLLSIDHHRATAEAKTYVLDTLVSEATLTFLIGIEIDEGPAMERHRQYHNYILSGLS